MAGTTTNPTNARVNYWAEILKQNPELGQALTPRLNKYIPVTPSPHQAVFLLAPQLEVLYGGAAGGGKSVAMLMAALQYVDVPGYAALLLRKSFAQLSEPGALMDMAHQWLSNTDAHWDGQNKTWTFPSGAALSFGYLDSDLDKYKYQGAQYQFIGFDELTQFPTEDTYTYLFSRLRRNINLKVPIRMRSTTNPGGVGAEWVYNRFLTEEAKKTGRLFIAAKMTDNPYINQEEYLQSLSNLGEVERAQLLEGKWDVFAKGDMFKREWFNILTERPSIPYIRFWDVSSRVNTKRKSDYTVGALVGLYSGRVTIADITRFQGTPFEVEELIRTTAQLDGPSIPIYMEQEGGSSGLAVIENYKKRVLQGYKFNGVRPKGNKEVRAKQWSSYVQAGKCDIVMGPWVSDFLVEVEAFPNGANDDQVDGVSGAISVHLNKTEPKARTIVVPHTPPNPYTKQRVVGYRRDASGKVITNRWAGW